MPTQRKARDNPFITAKLDALPYCLQGETWAGLVEKFREFNFCASVIGPKGSGKTAFLFTFQEILKQQQYAVRYLKFSTGQDLSYPEIQQYVARVSAEEIVLLDGGEVFSWSRQVMFYLLLVRVRGILLTSHFPCVLPRLYRCQTTPGLLVFLLRELLGRDFGGNHLAGVAADLDREDALELLAAEYFARSQGNLRQAMLDLYDRWFIDGAFPQVVGHS